jgi:uncharacterized membrane protein YccC
MNTARRKEVKSNQESHPCRIAMNVLDRKMTHAAIKLNQAKATWPPVLLHSARTAVAVVASILAAQFSRLPETHWAPITTLVITQSSLGMALSVSGERFMGTVLGATVGAIVASRFGPSSLVFGVSIFILGLLSAIAFRSQRVSICGSNTCNCAACTPDGLCMAHRPSSVR